MRIRRKLAWIFILLMVLSIMLTIGIAILEIQDHLYLRQVEKMATEGGRIARELGQQPTRVGTRYLQCLSTALPYTLDFSTRSGEIHFSTIRSEEFAHLSEVPRQQELPVLPTGQPYLSRQTDHYFWVYVPFSGPETSGVLSLGAPKDLVDYSLNPIRWILYNSMLVSITVVLGVSVILAIYLTRPLIKIVTTARRIAEGNLDDIIVDGKRDDELGVLAFSINKMAASLREDYNKLKQLNEKQKQFYADITHEVSNPLHTILMSLEMLELNPNLPDNQRQYLTLIGNNARRMARLFEDLVTLQRYDQDGYFIQPRYFDFAEVVSTVEANYRPQFERKGISLHVQHTPQRVYADPQKTEQILDNLLSNALKYTNQGHVQVSWRVEQSTVQVVIEDTGIGIAPEHIPFLTERFYRTDKARSRQEGGTGLGLSVVQSILESHGSQLVIESRLGEGSRFIFELPLTNTMLELSGADREKGPSPDPARQHSDIPPAT